MATKMSNMVLWAIGQNKNVSVTLALSLFDKQIIPILLYGAAIWSPPDTQNALYLLEQREDTRYNTRQLVSIALSDTVVGDMSYEYSKRVGKISNASNRKNIIRLHSFSGKKWNFALLSKYSVCLYEFWYPAQLSRERQHREGTYCIYEKDLECH